MSSIHRLRTLHHIVKSGIKSLLLRLPNHGTAVAFYPHGTLHLVRLRIFFFYGEKYVWLDYHEKAFVKLFSQTARYHHRFKVFKDSINCCVIALENRLRFSDAGAMVSAYHPEIRISRSRGEELNLVDRVL